MNLKQVYKEYPKLKEGFERYDWLYLEESFDAELEELKDYYSGKKLKEKVKELVQKYLERIKECQSDENAIPDTIDSVLDEVLSCETLRKVIEDEGVCILWQPDDARGNIYTVSTKLKQPHLVFETEDGSKSAWLYSVDEFKSQLTDYFMDCPDLFIGRDGLWFEIKCSCCESKYEPGCPLYRMY